MGIFFAILIIMLWSVNLYFSLSFVETSLTFFNYYAHILLQTYLFTGLFITAHDAMHGSISFNKTANKLFGWTAAFLFAGLSYKKLLSNHILHHKFPGTEQDPDYYKGRQNIFVWWTVFLFRYVSIIQLLIMALLFNFLKIFFSDESILSFWVVPAVLSTFQLFYFGTYKPHMQPHTNDMKPHNARTLKKNHFFAMISCYFFGYHHEHHESPHTPWWQMFKLKKANN